MTNPYQPPRKGSEPAKAWGWNDVAFWAWLVFWLGGLIYFIAALIVTVVGSLLFAR